MGLTKVCCVNQDDWYEKVTTVLWVYQTTAKRLNMYTLFQLVYGREVVVLAKFLTPSIFIAQVTKMTKDESIIVWVEELLELEKPRFLADSHQIMEKD